MERVQVPEIKVLDLRHQPSVLRNSGPLRCPIANEYFIAKSPTFGTCCQGTDQYLSCSIVYCRPTLIFTTLAFLDVDYINTEHHGFYLKPYSTPYVESSDVAKRWSVCLLSASPSLTMKDTSGNFFTWHDRCDSVAIGLQVAQSYAIIAYAYYLKL